MNKGCTELLRSDLRFQKSHSHLIIFCVAKPLRDFLPPCDESWFGVGEVNIGKIWYFHSLKNVETVAWYLSMKKLKTKVWLKLSGIQSKEKAAVKLGCTSSIEDGREILVLVDTEGTGYPRWVNTSMRGPHNKSVCSGPWQWGGMEHKQSTVEPWLIPVNICKGRSSANFGVSYGGELTSESHRNSPWKKEPTFIWGICYILIEYDLYNLFLLVHLPISPA